ncbi:50S ribosomal protein L16 [Candidatus Woesearchaeota archaeon]|nr:50S ribosomal protein L16 [Candidatus Woesearchaeota archaeon]
MAKLRRARAYRSMERPYTRVSKFKKKSYIRMTPTRKVTRFDMGELKQYGYTLDLVPKASIQIRQESIESARQTSLKWLEKNLAKGEFHFKIRKYPYHILRENPLASGAGADRVSTGMARPFGKPIGVALQIDEGDRFFTVDVNEDGINAARKALKRAAKKMPCSFAIQQNKN